VSWSVVERKVAGVTNRLNDWELQSLEREFVEITKRVSRISSAARSIRGVLFLDLAYALAKHRDWLQTNVFTTILVEFLQMDHGVPRNEAQLIVHDMIEAAIALGLTKGRAICCDDREFLTWAYVCAAEASDECALETELGLGTAVLQKLREGIKAIERVEGNIFVPEYDAMLASIILELAQETKKTPWALDYHRLKYAILSAGGDAAQPFILDQSLPIILDAIVAVGQGHSTALSERPALADLLVRASVLQEESPNGRRKKIGHVLSDLGGRLTGHKVALEVFRDRVDGKFFNLNSRWQLSIIRRSKNITFDCLVKTATEASNKLSPEVLEAIVHKMLEIDASSVTGELVKTILSSAQMAWHKAAIIRALRAGFPSPDLLEAVASELTSTASPGVRLAAGSLLDAWTD